MTYETVVLEKEEAIATLTLNRPEVMNAWNDKLAEDVSAALEEVNQNEAIRVLIITGAGKNFSSGLDVSLLAQLASRPASIMDTVLGRFVRNQENLIGVTLKTRQVSKPVIAAVNGAVVGGGLCFALACDIRIAAEDARFSAVFVKRGIIPDCGGTYFLPRAVGIAKACEMVFSGDFINAREAEKIGLVNKVVPSQELMHAAREMARSFAKNPPLTVKLAKQALYQGLHAPDPLSHLNFEAYANSLLMATEDFAEGVKSFYEKREPVFKSR